MVDSRECFLYVASIARRGRRGGYFSLQNLFALNSRLHGNLQHALRLSVCVCLRVCVCVCVAALMQYVKATRSIYSKYNNNNKSDNDSSNNSNDKYTKHEY